MATEITEDNCELADRQISTEHGTNECTHVDPNYIDKAIDEITTKNVSNVEMCIEGDTTEKGEVSFDQSPGRSTVETVSNVEGNTSEKEDSVDQSPKRSNVETVSSLEGDTTEKEVSVNQSPKRSTVETVSNVEGNTREKGVSVDQSPKRSTVEIVSTVEGNTTEKEVSVGQSPKRSTVETVSNVETCEQRNTTQKEVLFDKSREKSTTGTELNVEICAQTINVDNFKVGHEESRNNVEHCRGERKDYSSGIDTTGNCVQNGNGRNTRKRKPTRKKLRYISSSSDEDVPLIMYATKYQNIIDSDEDELFVPNSKDLNSTDSEYSSNLSDSTKRAHNAEKKFKKEWKKVAKHIEKRKMATTSKKTKPKISRKYPNSDSAIQEAERISFQEHVILRTLITANEGRLDQMLTGEGYKRIPVPPHGNCFFEAACMSNCITVTQSQLREALCIHLQENAETYMGFLINKHSPEDEEEFVCKYLGEIECLKRDGYWSSKVADLLPLALANYACCTLTIFTSKPDQPKIVIEPNMQEKWDNRHVYLAYISIPSVLEHYDGCIATPQPEMTATKLVIEQDKTKTPTRNQTPKKAAKFISPVKKHLFRKRKAMPQNWKKNVRKRLRIHGEEYIATTGKVIKRKSVKDCSKCKYKCNGKVSYEQRCTIRDFYYGLACYERQMDYICANVQEKTTKSYLDDEGKRVQKRKQVSRTYSFVVDNENVRVCKKFFLNTLSISQATVNQALSKKVGGHFQGKDERGRHKAPNKTSDEMVNAVREHIESFPVVDSHYTRKSTNRQFLSPELNIKRMYEAYVLKCAEKGTSAVKEPIYRRIFNEEYNMSFHVPKKDQCTLCNRYNNSKADGTLDEETKEEYLLHQQRKTAAREQKYGDSNKAKQDIRVHTCTFDLQSVLYTPCSLVSLMYYMRKLCCYNLSVYSAGDKTATCYLWSEIEGKRGSNEISTCISLYLKSLESRIEHVILYSDSCTGQNRNQIVATCLLHCFINTKYSENRP